MKPRTAVHLLVGIIVAVVLIFLASNLQAGSGSSLSELINAQKHTPVLWVVDVCAVGLVAGMWWAAAILNNFQSFVDHQARQHAEQLDDMIERTNEIERINDAYIDRIERLEAELARQYRDLSDQVATLEAASDARRKIFESETRRISEHAYRLFQSQLENNAGQLEAVHVAIQYQRAELRRLRNEIRELQIDIAPQRRVRSIGSADILDATPSAALPSAPNSELPTLFIEGSTNRADDLHSIEASPDSCSNIEVTSQWKSQVERLFHEAKVVEKLTDDDLGIASNNSAQTTSTTPSARDHDREEEARDNFDEPQERVSRGSALAPATEAMA